MRHPTPIHDGPEPVAKVSPADALPPGTRIGVYSLYEAIGRGGVATVYRAVSDDGQTVALKVLDERFRTNPDTAERFEAEARLMMGLEHPNLIRMLDHGEVDGHAFIALELIDGITLDQLIFNLDLTGAQYLRVIQEVGNGLTFVHARGIVHGDIKPSNIMVTRPGEVKIGDFGIAARLKSRRLLRTGPLNSAPGTIHYMAPEVLADTEHVDFRADIYSLTVAFYKMLTRKLPSPPVAPASMLNPGLPPGVDSVLLRGMRPNPDERYATVNELCDELSALFDDDVARHRDRMHPRRPSELVLAAGVEGHKHDAIDWRLIGLCIGAALVLAGGMIGWFLWGR